MKPHPVYYKYLRKGLNTVPININTTVIVDGKPRLKKQTSSFYGCLREPINVWGPQNEHARCHIKTNRIQKEGNEG